jgi:hypothetical protein
MWAIKSLLWPEKVCFLGGEIHKNTFFVFEKVANLA